MGRERIDWKRKLHLAIDLTLKINCAGNSILCLKPFLMLIFFLWNLSRKIHAAYKSLCHFSSRFIRVSLDFLPWNAWTRPTEQLCTWGWDPSSTCLLPDPTLVILWCCAAQGENMDAWTRSLCLIAVLQTFFGLPYLRLQIGAQIMECPLKWALSRNPAVFYVQIHFFCMKENWALGSPLGCSLNVTQSVKGLWLDEGTWFKSSGIFSTNSDVNWEDNVKTGDCKERLWRRVQIIQWAELF